MITAISIENFKGIDYPHDIYQMRIEALQSEYT